MANAPDISRDSSSAAAQVTQHSEEQVVLSPQTSLGVEHSNKQRWGMFLNVLWVVLLGLGVSALAIWIMGLALFGALAGQPWIPAAANTTVGDEGWLALIKVAITIAAGVGGATALVVAYRKQKLAEKHEPRQIAEDRRAAAAAERELQRSYLEQYRAAVDQLGHANATVRLAGVYALANLADAWSTRRQQCVDVLCAHLRTPWNPPTPGETVLGVTQVQKTAEGTTITRTYPDHSGESQVRATILRVIGAHLLPGSNRPEGYESWSGISLDLANGLLPALNWGRCLIPTVDFTGAQFNGTTKFAGATFSGTTAFNETTFKYDAEFTEVTFSTDAEFTGATFSGYALFKDATFAENAWFWNATFTKPTVFHDATIVGSSGFAGGTFSAFTDFAHAAFGEDAWFGGATFRADDVSKLAVMTSPIIANEAESFTMAREITDELLASGDSPFEGSYNVDIKFKGATFSGSVVFNAAVFSGLLGLGGTVFDDDVEFLGASFARAVSYPGAIFARGVPGQLRVADEARDSTVSDSIPEADLGAGV